MIEHTTTNKDLTLEMDMDKFLKAIEQFSEHVYEMTEILLGNPFDLIEIDMYKIPSNCVFISDYHIDKGTMYQIKDSELKRSLYDFIKKHPDGVFRGKR